MEGKFNVDLVLVNQANDLVQQRPVFEHQQMGVEDARIFRP